MLEDCCIIFIHYHLNGGGVTKVIEQQSAALTELHIPHLVLCGENTSGCQIPHQIIAGLNYTATGLKREQPSPLEVVEKIYLALEQQYSKQFIFHFHNHSIGLNWRMGEIVTELGKKNRLLLQVHDFVEDGRQKNLPNINKFEEIYPSASHIHYCTINSRDRDILSSIGANTTLLPNCINSHARKPQSIEKLIFYPVQALRRKNLGELLLLALAAPEDYQFAIALTPKESSKLVQYWSSVSDALDLSVTFDASKSNADSANFQQFYEKSSHIISTSIQEGFGMAFIEPIYYEKTLFGRDLPSITIDLKNHGIDHSLLYSAIQIELPSGNYPDFGNLSEAEQTHILHTLKAQPAYFEKIIVMTSRGAMNIQSYLKQVLTSNKTIDFEKLKPWLLPQLKINLKEIYTSLIQSDISEVTVLPYKEIRNTFSNEPFHALKHGEFVLPKSDCS